MASGHDAEARQNADEAEVSEALLQLGGQDGCISYANTMIPLSSDCRLVLVHTRYDAHE